MIAILQSLKVGDYADLAIFVAKTPVSSYNRTNDRKHSSPLSLLK